MSGQNQGSGALGSAAIGAGGSLVSSGINWLAQRNLQKLTNKQNIEFWNMQNEYNHPAQQRKRLEEAGLNPAMLYGKGTSSGAASGNAGPIAPSKTPSWQAPNLGGDAIQALSAFMDLRVKEAQEKNINQDTNTSSARELLIIQQTATEEFNTIVREHNSEMERLRVDFEQKIRGQGKYAKLKTAAQPYDDLRYSGFQQDTWKKKWDTDQAYYNRNILGRTNAAQSAIELKHGLDPWIKREIAFLDYALGKTKSIQLNNKLMNLRIKYYEMEKLLIPGASILGNYLDISKLTRAFGGKPGYQKPGGKPKPKPFRPQDIRPAGLDEAFGK